MNKGASFVAYEYDVTGREGESISAMWERGDEDILFVIKVSGEERLIHLSEKSAAKLGLGLIHIVGRMREGRQK